MAGSRKNINPYEQYGRTRQKEFMLSGMQARNKFFYSLAEAKKRILEKCVPFEDKVNALNVSNENAYYDVMRQQESYEKSLRELNELLIEIKKAYEEEITSRELKKITEELYAKLSLKENELVLGGQDNFGQFKEILLICCKFINNDDFLRGLNLIEECIKDLLSYFLEPKHYKVAYESFKSSVHKEFMKLREGFSHLGCPDEKMLRSKLDELYDSYRNDAAFATKRKEILEGLVPSIKLIVNDKEKQTQLLNIAYHHAFFSEHRHLTGIRDAFNRAYNSLRTLNCCSFFAGSLQRNLIETNSQKALAECVRAKP